MSVSQILSITVFVGAYVLIATERIHRVAAALGGAALMLALGLTNGETAFHSLDAGVDWNVVFLLLGMMIIVGVIKQTGLFEYLAIAAAKRAKGKPFAVMVLFVIITAVASAALDNVTTVLLIAPVTFLVCDRLNLNPIPFLIAEVLASNIGGAATLIGDPPNIIIASRAGLSFNDFLIHMAPFAIFMMAVFVLVCRWLFRSAFKYDEKRVAEVMALNERDAIRDSKLLWQSMIVLALVMVGFVLHSALHVEPSVVALLGAGVLVMISKITTEEAIADVEWETLVFFMGLFIMVGALVKTGVIDKVSQALADAVGGQPLLAVMALLGISAVLSAIVDNIPYVATMSPIVSDLVAAQGGTPQAESLWWSLALGADLGGNATAVGASANVVMLGLAARNGTPISFWQFTRYGIIVAALSILLAAPYLWLRYFVLA
ncbi:Na+/H+ antiporter NhaD [Actinokineospora alba]|uniref:Na+/H+ antiporter NhaD n=1 Tax=Actinokineospora alba TaxID=504798 RepID=A0A1H0FPW7_9PSEU|nr:ArsB/NhaD family transporter [Actinokineospora alba]TDP69566.1 Na+/H+ antiporter NhaD/arsenite permease-like protein [Actinokineospora alba]SDI14007.1 Na+/H+ antiporter NhaD [Actinokineospora alba]SDN96706.1 Na+/H+ antiporter NhaD [Actinokineospora alba]